MTESIKEIQAECKTVTPMLVSGANQQEFELRVAEIKSALRFWWRAFQPDGGESLAKREKELFGSTDGRCPFQLRVNAQCAPWAIWQPGNSVEWPNGLSYILYPVYDAERKKNDNNPGHPARIKPKDDSNPGRPVAKPGQPFQINFKFKSFTKDNNLTHAKNILSALWLLENFGGIGGRTRRGAGCFEITSLKINGKSIQETCDKETTPDWFTDIPSFFFKKDQKPGDFVKNGLEKIIAAWGCKDIKVIPRPNYTTYCQELSEVRVAWDNTTTAGAMGVMAKIGQEMREKRKNQPHEEARAMHESMAKAIFNNNFKQPAVATIKKAALGMPIIYNFHEDSANPRSGMLKKPQEGNRKSSNATFTLQAGKINDRGAKEKGSERRSSPLLISCHQKGGFPYAVFCHLPAQLLPDGEKLYLASNYEDSKIGAILEIPGHEFAVNVMRDICGNFTKNECLSQATWHKETVSQTPSNTTIQSPLPKKQEEKKAPEPTVKKRTPAEILHDEEFKKTGDILVRLAGSPNSPEKTRPCVCLTLKEDGTVAEEKGFTVKTQDVRFLSGIKEGELLAGKKNPQDPKRLNELKRM